MEFSESALEAMRGNFILAGEEGVSSNPSDLEFLADPRQLDIFANPTEAAAQFFNTTQAPLSVNAQFAVNNFLMTAMGFRMPTLETAKQQRLEEIYEAIAVQGASGNEHGPFHRLIAAPVFASDSNLFQQRSTSLYNFQNADLDNGLLQTDELLAVHSVGVENRQEAYSRLLLGHPSDLILPDNDRPGISIPDPCRAEKLVGLRYKSPLDMSQKVDRATYLQHLRDSQKAVEDETGLLWTFNFVDISPYPTVRTSLPADFEAIAPTHTPETEIAIQALRFMANKYPPNLRTEDYLANESVYVIEGDAAQERWVAGSVYAGRWGGDARFRVYCASSDVTGRPGTFDYLRLTESAL